MARIKKNDTALTLEEKLQQALVSDWEWPYKLPENWCWVTLGSVNKFAGRSVDPLKEPNEMFELYSVPSSVEDYPEILHGSEIGSTKQAVEQNDVLLCKINPRINRVWHVHKHTEHKLLASSEWIVIRNNSINTMFLQHCLRSEYFREYMLSNVSGVGGSLMRAQPKHVYGYPIPLAPFPEQQRIVDRIESLFVKLDEAKEKAQATLDSFETRKAAILHKAFSGVLTAKWRAEHGMDLASWTTDEIINRFDVAGGVQKSPMRTPKNNPIPYLTVANVFRDRLDLTEIRYFEVFEGELNKLKLEKKDILVVEGNGSGNEIGRCAMWNNELPVCIHQNHIIRLRSKDQNTIPEYVLYYLNSDTGKRIMRERAKTTAGLFNLSTGKIKTIPIPFASCNEQKEIVALLDKLFAKEAEAKEAAEMVLDQIDQMKKAILSRAFRGELGTNDPTEESALELLKSILVDKKQEIEDKPSKKRLVIPNEVAALLSSNLEKELIKIFYKEDRDLVPMSRLMAVSSKKFEVIGAIKKLQQKGIIQKTDNGDFKLVR